MCLKMPHHRTEVGKSLLIVVPWYLVFHVPGSFWCMVWPPPPSLVISRTAYSGMISLTFSISSVFLSVVWWSNPPNPPPLSSFWLDHVHNDLILCPFSLWCGDPPYTLSSHFCLPLVCVSDSVGPLLLRREAFTEILIISNWLAQQPLGKPSGSGTMLLWAVLFVGFYSYSV